MSSFEKAYESLNPGQRKAVDTIYGPVLVIAGPGTGKTQLLSARVAHILNVTDADASNILCLTFTESGALNMRERLTRFIGPRAYDTTISTYHGFGSSLIGRFPQYFNRIRLERPIDEITRHKLISALIADFDFNSPLLYLRHSSGDLINTISELKRGLVTPELLRAIADDNIRTIAASADAIAETLSFASLRMPSKLDKALQGFQVVSDILSDTSSTRSAPRFPTLGELARQDLKNTLNEAEESGKTKPLTAWKNKWLEKNADNQFRLKGSLEAERAVSLSYALESYNNLLQENGLYDFDDMILEAINVLEANDELRFTLQEQYQFILLDEFQDTNAAQLRLVELLTNNPIHEGKPNVLAVGDDDQAIYAFQGAEVSNMLDFSRMYRDVEVVPLTENYRSSSEILETADRISTQIDGRLHHHFESVDKTLKAMMSPKSPTTIERVDYLSDVAERNGIAAKIKRLIEEGTVPQEIAVIAPRHRLLESLVPFLSNLGVAVSYEKRENVLDNPRIKELTTMAQLVLALSSGNPKSADHYWPEVLSYDFWAFSVSDIWKTGWQASDKKTAWSRLLIDHPQFKHAALLMLTLASKIETATAEEIFDALIGTTDVVTNDRSLPTVRSPFREYYLRSNGSQTLYETISAVTVLREKYREYTAFETNHLSTRHLLEFIAAYSDSGQQMLNTSPHNQAAAAVKLMTVYKAKGLEFEHVFLLDVQDNVWGKSATGNNNKLPLPTNIESIRHSGTNDDEKLRDLFVAVTRAKYGLHLMSYRNNYAGKQPERLKYLDEFEEDDQLISRILPKSSQKAITVSDEATDITSLELNWLQKHTDLNPSLKELLTERLAGYQMSPTHLTKFIDLKYGGPESFLIETLLHFPSAPSLDSLYGNTVHSSLEWLQNELNLKGVLPPIAKVIDFGLDYIESAAIPSEQKSSLIKRYSQSIEAYLRIMANQYKTGNVAEKNFRSEAVLINDEVRMSGKIDLLEIDEENKTITVVDYKTSKPHETWKGSDVSLHKYQLQLYCYKLLVENSRSYRGYKVNEGRLEFTQPTDDGRYVSLALSFDEEEVGRIKNLLTAVWRRIQNVELPSIDEYGDNLKAILDFENYLIEK